MNRNFESLIPAAAMLAGLAAGTAPIARAQADATLHLRDFTVTLTANPNPIYFLKPVEHPTELQMKIYRSWPGVK